MKKTNYKKGFTLAELLIVVAIIAVLAAIAVPLFVGSLNTAEQRVQDANRRAVKGIAIAEILGKEEYRTVTVGNEKKEANQWNITAKVDKTGNVTELKIEAKFIETKNEGDTNTKPEAKDGNCVKNSEGGYDIDGMQLTAFEVKPKS